MREQWEYKTIWANPITRLLKDTEGTSYGRFRWFRGLDEMLNGLGRDGWEVCGITTYRWFAVILKRRIASA